MKKAAREKSSHDDLRQARLRNRDDVFGPNSAYAKNKERHEALKKR